MMYRFQLFHLELKQLWRQGILPLYLVLGLLLLPVLLLLPPQWRKTGMFLILYVNAVLGGLLFSGGLALLEAGENLIPALEIIPGGRKRVLLLRIGSFACLAGFMTAGVIAAGGIMFRSVNTAVMNGFTAIFLTMWIMLSSVPATVLGIISAGGKESTNGFLFSVIPLMLLFLPAVVLLFVNAGLVASVWGVSPESGELLLGAVSMLLPGGSAVLAARGAGIPWGSTWGFPHGTTALLYSAAAGANLSFYSITAIRKYLATLGEPGVKGGG